VGIYSSHHLTYETLIRTYETAGRHIPNNVTFVVITGRKPNFKILLTYRRMVFFGEKYQGNKPSGWELH